MPDYEKMYYCLFNAITDALRALEKTDAAAAQERLIEAQRKTEEIYMETASRP